MFYKFLDKYKSEEESLEFEAEKCELRDGYFILTSAKLKDGSRIINEFWIKSDTIDIVTVNETGV